MCGIVPFNGGSSPKLDSLISYGIALVHHMTYDDAELIFKEVISQDPDCFWGRWRQALTFIQSLA